MKTEQGMKSLAKKLAKEKQEKKLKWDDNLPPGQQRQVITRARDVYLQDYPYSTIFLLTNLPYRQFYKKENSWKKLKEKVDKHIIEKIRKDAISEKAEKFVYMGLDLGLKFLDRCIKKGKDFDAKDFKLVMDSVMAIHRVKQLETGQATEISKELNALTPDQLKDYLQNLKQEIQGEHGDLLPFDNLTPQQVLDSISKIDGEH